MLRQPYDLSIRSITTIQVNSWLNLLRARPIAHVPFGTVSMRRRISEARIQSELADSEAAGGFELI